MRGRALFFFSFFFFSGLTKVFNHGFVFKTNRIFFCRIIMVKKKKNYSPPSWSVNRRIKRTYLFLHPLLNLHQPDHGRHSPHVNLVLRRYSLERHPLEHHRLPDNLSRPARQHRLTSEHLVARKRNIVGAHRLDRAQIHGPITHVLLELLARVFEELPELALGLGHLTGLRCGKASLWGRRRLLLGTTW